MRLNRILPSIITTLGLQNILRGTAARTPTQVEADVQPEPKAINNGTPFPGAPQAWPQSPTIEFHPVTYRATNQRKDRKNQRRLWAAGNRKAFA
jgi:hypothetical protein